MSNTLPPAEILQAEPPSDHPKFRMVIGSLAMVGGLAGLAALFFVHVPEGNKEPLMLALGVILGWGGSVVQYEYGSSAGSTRKTAMLERRAAE